MEPLDPQLRQLIDEALPVAQPGAGAQERGTAALLAQLEAAPGPVATPSAPAGVGAGKLALVIATAVGLGAAGWLATRPDSDPPRAARDRPAASVDAALPEHAPAPESRAAPGTTLPTAELQPTPVRPSTPHAAPPDVPAPSEVRATGSVPPRRDTLRAEAELVARAESALDRGNAEEAGALCERHRTTFSTPQLRTECRAITASAACALDGTDIGKAQAFVRSAPRSALSTKVRRLCGLGSTPILRPSGHKAPPRDGNR